MAATSRDSLSTLSIQVLGRFMFSLAFVLILFLGAARALGDAGGKLAGILLVVGSLILSVVAWTSLLWLAVERGRAAGIVRDDDRDTWLMERGLDGILLACIAAEALRLAAMDTRILEICFGAVGMFLALTKLILAAGLGIPAGTWPLARIALIVALVTGSFFGHG